MARVLSDGSRGSTQVALDTTPPAFFELALSELPQETIEGPSFFLRLVCNRCVHFDKGRQPQRPQQNAQGIVVGIGVVVVPITGPPRSALELA